MMRITFKTSYFCLLLVISSSFVPQQSMAHGRYIISSHSVLSGEEPESVTLTASISNDFFHPDRAFGDDGSGVVDPELSGLFKILDTYVIDPTGNRHPLAWQAYSRLSIADLTLDQTGSYRIISQQPPTLMTTFKKSNGERGRFFGEGEVPAGASEVMRRLISSRVELFLSKNAPNTVAMDKKGNGLELSGPDHPNDLYTGETYQFSFTHNGKPLTQAAELVITRGGTRYRDSRDSQKITTSETGEFEINFSQAGVYLLEAEISFSNPEPNIDVAHDTLYLSLVVLPE